MNLPVWAARTSWLTIYQRNDSCCHPDSNSRASEQDAINGPDILLTPTDTKGSTLESTEERKAPQLLSFPGVLRTSLFQLVHLGLLQNAHSVSRTGPLFCFIFVCQGWENLFSFCFHITISKNSPHLKQHSNSEVFTSQKSTDSIQFWHNLLEYTLRLEYSQTAGSAPRVPLCPNFSCQSSVGFPILLTQWLKHEKGFLKTCRNAAWGTWKSSAPEQQENDVSTSSEATVYSDRDSRHY